MGKNLATALDIIYLYKELDTTPLCFAPAFSPEHEHNCTTKGNTFLLLWR